MRKGEGERGVTSSGGEDISQKRKEKKVTSSPQRFETVELDSSDDDRPLVTPFLKETRI